MAEKYKVHIDRRVHDPLHDFSSKGWAFAFAKRKAPKEGLKIVVTRFVSVHKTEVNQKDLHEGRYWWRAVKRWNFHPDGSVEALVLK